jgi:hypothetical protein
MTIGAKWQDGRSGLAPNAQRERVVHRSGATRAQYSVFDLDQEGVWKRRKIWQAVLSLLALLKGAA